MAQQGRGMEAIGIAAMASLSEEWGTAASFLSVPPLAEIALKFGHADSFS
jgi:TctA family transporter